MKLKVLLVKLQLSTITVVLMLSIYSISNAATVLYYLGGINGTDYYDIVLANRGDTVTKVLNASDFNTQLTGGTSWDIVIVSENGAAGSATYEVALASYVNGGGAAVFNNWYADNDIDEIFESIAGAPTNQTSITINAAGIAAGLDTNVDTNPMTLTNTGWGTFSQALTATGTGESRADFATGSAAVFGNNGATMRLGFIPDTLSNTDNDAVDFLTNAVASVHSAATSIPTLSEWGMMIMSILLGITAIVYIRRQRIDLSMSPTISIIKYLIWRLYI